jgi:glycosyltransferase involved in cell wall biosynthesis
MVDFTIAIPTYNGEKRLPEVLDRLKAQIDTENIAWEILVVDNNSNDNTVKVVREYQANWSDFPLKYYLEKRQGAAFARLKAVEEAKSELIGFLDDDNIPAVDWVSNAVAFARSHPQAGAFGSRIYGDFEVTPPHNFYRIAAFLALTDRGAKPRIYNPSKKVLPPSAGLVIRRQAWLDCVPNPPILSGRIPGSMLTGEDLEAIAHIQQAGWEIWYNSAMQVHHKIPRHRLERGYLIRFFRGIGLGRHVTRMLSIKPWQRPFAMVGYALNDLRKIAMHLYKYRNKVRTDVVAACEMELYLSCLISPFYLWSKGYLSKSSRKMRSPSSAVDSLKSATQTRDAVIVSKSVS